LSWGGDHTRRKRHELCRKMARGRQTSNRPDEKEKGTQWEGKGQNHVGKTLSEKNVQNRWGTITPNVQAGEVEKAVQRGDRYAFRVEEKGETREKNRRGLG